MKNFYCKLLIAILLAFYIQNGKAQNITDYSFESSSGTYTYLTGGTTRALTAGTALSGYFNGIPIGFTFNYMGTNYTTISASTNGWFTFGSNISSAAPTNNLRTGTPRPIIAPLWDDLDLQAASNLSYRTTGTAGSRVFTIEYKNVQWNASASGNTISFQVRLYEATRAIEFIYKSEYGSVYWGSASIGIAGPSSNSFLSVYENTFWGFPLGTFGASSTDETNDINSKPGTGTTYSFTPPVACSTPTVSATATNTCSGSNGGTISASASGGTSFTYSLNGGAFQTSNTFTGLAAGSYTITAKSSTGCLGSTTATVGTNNTASTDNQNTAGDNSWIGHVYDGTNFLTYMGQTTETELFDENFGAAATCFELTSGSGTSSIYTETYSVKFRMNSTKSGLYVVSLGSDDGARLSVDGTMVYNNWNDHSFMTSNNVLIGLSGSSSLLYEYYENGTENRVTFQNLTRLFGNTLSTNTSQTLCVGSGGSSISGDVMPASTSLPTGISNAGYQWTYSTTPNGTRINISGAVAADGV